MSSIDFFFYNSSRPIKEQAAFLAGPTTDKEPGEWRGNFEGVELSAWRAQLARELQNIGWSGTLIVPEFSEKGVGGDWFAPLAQSHFGGGRGALRWEEEMMIRADVVVGWADVRFEGPGIGLNARPELYGLLIRHRTAEAVSQFGVQIPGLPWAPKKLAFGIPPTARKIARFYEEAGTLTFASTLAELAAEVQRLTV